MAGAFTGRTDEREVNEDKDLTTYIVTCKDGEGSLKRLIEYIGTNGNTGHSFNIVVDPGSDSEESFGWDGDGRDYIKSVVEK